MVVAPKESKKQAGAMLMDDGFVEQKPVKKHGNGMDTFLEQLFLT